jgi:heat shock protein HtpX
MRGPTLKERLQVGLGRISPLDRFGQGLLAIAVLYLVGAIWWNSQFIRYALRAKPVSRAEAPELYDVIENLAITAGVPCPAIEVIDTPALNAYASGLSPKTARLGVTTGLIAALDRSELEAVIAHELVHILQRDSRLMAVTKACVDLVLPRRRFFKANWRIFLALLFVFFSVFSLATLMVFASMLIAIAVLTLVAKALVLHAREFVADAGAVEITKNPVALISALRKIASSDEMTISNLATEAMMFTGSLKGVLGTHPRIEDRVAYIKKYADVREDEVTLHTILSEREIGKSVAVSGPVFGRRRGKIVRAGAIAPPAAKRSIGTFPIEERRRAIWKDSRVFEPVEAATQGVTALAGETWFERWVMTGRLRKVRQRLARYVTSPIKYVGLTLLAFNLGFILFFWSRAFPLAGIVAASMALGAVLVCARLSNARRNS